MRCYRKLLEITYLDYISKDEVYKKVQMLLVSLMTYKTSSGTVTVLWAGKGIVEETRRRDRQKKRWEDTRKD